MIIENGNRAEKKMSVDIAFIVVLFCVFVTTVLFVLMMGAGVYKKASVEIEEDFNKSTALQMLVQKVRNYDFTGSVIVKNNDDMGMLILSENIDEEEYYTYLYTYEGQLRELFVLSSYDFKPEDGTALFPAENFSVKSDRNLLTISYVIGDETTKAVVHLRSGEAVL